MKIKSLLTISLILALASGIEASENRAKTKLASVKFATPGDIGLRTLPFVLGEKRGFTGLKE